MHKTDADAVIPKCFQGAKVRLRQKAQFSHPSLARNFLPLHTGHSFPSAFSRKGPKTGESCHADKTAGIKSCPSSPVSFYFCTKGTASFKAFQYQLLQRKVNFQQSDAQPFAPQAPLQWIALFSKSSQGFCSISGCVCVLLTR